MKNRIDPKPSLHRKPVRFESFDDENMEDRKQTGVTSESSCRCCCQSSGQMTNGCLIFSIIGVLFLIILAIVIPLVVIILLNKGKETSGSSTATLKVNLPKRLGIYYGWPSLVHNANGNLTLAIETFNQFDLIVFGDGLSSSSHGDHSKTQTIIRGLNSLGKLTFGYVDLGVTTQNLSISQMQTNVNDWASMGIKGIMFDDAGYDFGVTRSRQNTMISYCHSLNLRVMMNAWNPDDVMGGSSVLLDSRDIYLLESYLISIGNYQNLTFWKIKADKCLSYSSSLGVSMACLSTSARSISASFGSTQKFVHAWFGTAIYNFDYFQATDSFHSSTNNLLYSFSNPISFYGNHWQTNDVQTDSNTHFYRSTDTNTIHIYGNGINTGSANVTSSSNG